MRNVKKDHKKTLNLLLGLLGSLLILLACACFALLLSLRVPGLWGWYYAVQQHLLQMEHFVRGLRPHLLFVTAVLLLFALRSVLPLLSVSAICLMSGVVLPVYAAIPVNLLGVGLMMSLHYARGKRSGGGRAWRFFVRNVPVRDLLEKEGARNPWLLFALRALPRFPQGSVSRVYGAMQLPWRKYLLVSLAGFAPKLISYTFIGQNVFDPLSASFLTPIILVLLLSGLSLLFLNTIWSWIDKQK